MPGERGIILPSITASRTIPGILYAGCLANRGVNLAGNGPASKNAPLMFELEFPSMRRDQLHDQHSAHLAECGRLEHASFDLLV